MINATALRYMNLATRAAIKDGTAIIGIVTVRQNVIGIDRGELSILFSPATNDKMVDLFFDNIETIKASYYASRPSRIITPELPPTDDNGNNAA
jgi:hypothetical protein